MFIEFFLQSNLTQEMELLDTIEADEIDIAKDNGTHLGIEDREEGKFDHSLFQVSQ